MRSHFHQSIDAVALVATTAKTVVELSTPATTRARIVDFWIDFDGTTPTNSPVKCEIGRFSAAVTTATTLAGVGLDPGDPAPQSTFKNSTTVEGAGTPTLVFIRRVPATSGLQMPQVLAQELIIPVSGFFRIRLTAAQAVNACVGLTWEE